MAARIEVLGLADDIRELTDAIQTDVRFMARSTATEIISFSPVLTGFFVRNWNVSFGTPDGGVSGVRPNVNVRVFPNPNLFGAQSWTVNQGDIHFANGVDYGIYLDAGSSGQAPQGVTQPVAAIIDNRFSQVI